MIAKDPEIVLNLFTINIFAAVSNGELLLAGFPPSVDTLTFEHHVLDSDHGQHSLF